MDDVERVFTHAQDDAADGFVEGNFLHNRRGHVAMPVCIWWGLPRDHEHGGFMDRSPRWNLEIAGETLIEDERVPVSAMATLADVWPRCRGANTVRSDTAYRHARREHAQQHDANDPFGHRHGRLDLLTATIPHL